MNKLSPLEGRRVLVTRSSKQSGELAKLIANAGGEAIEFPVIELREPEAASTLAELDAALAALEQYDWILFTSVNGVEFFFSRLQHLRIDVRSMHRARIAAVGPKTLAALEQRGLYGERLPDEYIAEGLLDSIRPKLKRGQKVLLPRANIARKMLPEALHDLGLEVDDVVVYENHLVDEGAEAVVELLRQRRIDMISFTSSSTVRNFMSILQGFSTDPLELIGKHVTIACIGRLTAETAEEYGLTVHCLAKEATIPALLAAMIEHSG